MNRICTLFLLIPLVAVSATGNWKTFTNSSQIRQMAIADSMVWCATNGGVLAINTHSLTYEHYTNTEGLAQIDVVALAYDDNGFVWVAMPDGLLQILNLDTGDWDAYNEFQNRLEVLSFLAHDDFVLVGYDEGIAELRLDQKNRWERTWKAEIGPVRDILIADGYIWVAQNDGVRRMSMEFPNKQIPNAWERFGLVDGLPSEEVNALAYFDNQVVAGTQIGLVFYDGIAWHSAQQLEHEVRDLSTWNNTLSLASDRGVFYLDNSDAWARLGNPGTHVQHLGATDNGWLWAGTDNNGLEYYSVQAAQWSNFTANGPGSNTFSDLLIDEDGHMWATSSHRPNGGVYYFNGTTWQNWHLSNGLAHYDYRSLELDPFGRIWASSWGGGVTLFEKTEGDSINVTNLGAMDDNLSGIATSPTYVVVTHLALDKNNYMWFLNYTAGDKQVLDVFDLDNSWQHWTSTEGIRAEKVISLAIDQFGRKWIGTEGNGLSVLDDNETPFDKSDDDLSGFLDTTEGLESNYINALAEDLDGTIWIGTSEGLNYWFGGQVGARYSVINDNIQALYVDPRNNKWIGTAGGLSVLDSDNFSWTHYTTSNSPVVSDFITCFALNEETGDMYIGTTNGLSRFATPFTKPADNLDSVNGYPNPFLLEPENSRFYIDNLALNSSVSIFTPEGYLVKTIPNREILGARVSWDGTNNDGEYVTSGVYLYLVTTKDGQIKTGKVAVVR